MVEVEPRNLSKDFDLEELSSSEEPVQNENEKSEEKNPPESEEIETETCASSFPAAPEKKIKQKPPIRPFEQVVDSCPSKQGTIFVFCPFNFFFTVVNIFSGLFN